MIVSHSLLSKCTEKRIEPHLFICGNFLAENYIIIRSKKGIVRLIERNCIKMLRKLERKKRWHEESLHNYFEKFTNKVLGIVQIMFYDNPHPVRTTLNNSFRSNYANISLVKTSITNPDPFVLSAKVRLTVFYINASFLRSWEVSSLEMRKKKKKKNVEKTNLSRCTR